MFDQLTARLARTLETLRGRGRITEENIADALRETRVALLEADVALPVVKAFIESVKAQALGAEVAASLTPGQAFIGILHARAGRAHGRRGRGVQAACAAAGRGAARGPAGRRQDHHRGQARALPHRARAQARAAREHRRAPAGGDAAARAACRAGARRVFPGRGGCCTCADRTRRARARAQRRVRRTDRRHRGPAARR